MLPCHHSKAYLLNYIILLFTLSSSTHSFDHVHSSVLTELSNVILLVIHHSYRDLLVLVHMIVISFKLHSITLYNGTYSVISLRTLSIFLIVLFCRIYRISVVASLLVVLLKEVVNLLRVINWFLFEVIVEFIKSFRLGGFVAEHDWTRVHSDWTRRLLLL